MRQQPFCSLIVFLNVSFLLIGCDVLTQPEADSPGLPTLLPTAALLAPTLEAEDAPQIADNGLPVTNTPPPATPTPSLTPTPDPRTPTATPTPDFSINPAVNITALTADNYLAGEPVTLSGRATFRTDQTLIAALVELDGTLISEAEVAELSFGSWEATLPISETVSGHLYFEAEIRESDGSMAALDRVRITVEPNRDADRFLALDRPVGDERAAAGYNFFFDGLAEQPANFVVNIGILAEDCQTILSRQSFTLRGSGYWQGFVVVPEAASGPACAQAWFGEPESDSYRRVMYEIEVGGSEDDRAVLIANPPPESIVKPGERVTFYGTAYFPVDDEVSLTIRQGDGRVVASETAIADRFGYWETDILLPVELAGDIEVTAATGDRFDLLILNVDSQ